MLSVKGLYVEMSCAKWFDNHENSVLSKSIT